QLRRPHPPPPSSASRPRLPERPRAEVSPAVFAAASARAARAVRRAGAGRRSRARRRSLHRRPRPPVAPAPLRPDEEPRRDDAAPAPEDRRAQGGAPAPGGDRRPRAVGEQGGRGPTVRSVVLPGSEGRGEIRTLGPRPSRRSPPPARAFRNVPEPPL